MQCAKVYSKWPKEKKNKYTQISPFRNLTPKKWDMNGHLISSMLPDHNFMGIPVKKRDMNAIHPRFLNKGEIVRSERCEAEL